MKKKLLFGLTAVVIVTVTSALILKINRKTEINTDIKNELRDNQAPIDKDKKADGGTEMSEKILNNNYIRRVTDYAGYLMEEGFKTVDTPQKSFIWDTEGKNDSWRYYNGVMLDGFWRAGIKTESGDALDFLSRYYDVNITQDGKIARFGSDIALKQELDSILAARPLFYLIGTDKWQDKYELALNSIYTQLSDSSVFTAYENCGGNLLHKPNWTDFHIGLDGVYMYMPFLMEYAYALENNQIQNPYANPQEIYKSIYERIMWVSENMYDEKTKLLNHGWNVQTNTGNGHFWGRGIGWCLAAMADVIEIMPIQAYKNDLISELKKLSDGVLIYQDKGTKMWYNVINRDSSLSANNGNHLETSATALIAYTLMKANNNGWLGLEYGKAGLEAFEGIVKYKMTSDFTLSDIYKASGVLTSDEEYCKNSYVENEGKGAGPFIIAMAEAKKQYK